MNTNKAAYWIALGVLVLGLNSEYRQGRFVALHRAAERADSLLCIATTRAEQSWAFARLLTARDEFPAHSMVASADSADLAWDQAELVREQAREQTELIRDQVRKQILAQREVIREQADMRRAELERIREQARSQIGLVRMVNGGVTLDCPKSRTRIMVDRETNSTDISPEIEVEDEF